MTAVVPARRPHLGRRVRAHGLAGVACLAWSAPRSIRPGKWWITKSMVLAQPALGARNWRLSQARARAQSRLAVASEIPRTEAASSRLKPVK